MSVVEEQHSFEPMIIAFCCNWCSYAGADLAGTGRMSYPANIRIVRVPCSGRVSPNFILRAFQRGADGVVVAGCHPGDCHYVSGNYHARRRFSALRRFLEFVGIETERFEIHWISASEGNRFATIMQDVTAKIRVLGPNRKLRDAR
jgi:F420-non-reducing hydrogenase iron-sulfur subunit